VLTIGLVLAIGFGVVLYFTVCVLTVYLPKKVLVI